jgi:demethylmenaquinone methyltransferase/2-methoxy-6-polyprenyl-1,4-benzoquinol methylase
VLDCGTGTADVAIEVAKVLKKRGGGEALSTDAVVGIDPSSNMLAHGRAKVAAAGFEATSVRLVQGDAQDLSKTLAPHQRFDAATMAFAIRNVPDRLKALKSIASHLKPGARLAVLELGEPTFPPARWFVKYCVPVIGALLSGGARAEYEHLEKSVMNFHKKDFVSLIEHAGLDLVGVRYQRERQRERQRESQRERQRERQQETQRQRQRQRQRQIQKQRARRR